MAADKDVDGRNTSGHEEWGELYVTPAAIIPLIAAAESR